MKPQAIVVIAFGGPESMEEVRPFLARVLAGRPVPPERVEEVVHHYEVIGGRSPGPEISRAQTAALTTALREAGCELPVKVALRTSAPFIEDVLAELKCDGAAHVLGVIMAAHESDASHGRYREAVERARTKLGDAAPSIAYSGPFFRHDGFIRANVEHIERALAQLPESARRAAPIVATAHSIPTSVAEPYVTQLNESARLVGGSLGRPLRIAYQSRSGSPRDPWLEPDVCDALRELAAKGEKHVVVAPLGFLCDHVEVLYDLDVEAAQLARELDVQLVRAGAPGTHPAFIRALADSVIAAL